MLRKLVRMNFSIAENIPFGVTCSCSGKKKQEPKNYKVTLNFYGN